MNLAPLAAAVVLSILSATNISTAISSKAVPGPYLVGQPIEIRVTITGSTRREIEPPAVADVLVREIGHEAGGSVVRYAVIPFRHGLLEIPPFRLRVDNRTVTSRPIRLTIANIPISGRTPAFLGGVGSFEVLAEADPSKLRAGQTFEFRLKIAGPAAFGSIRAPDLTTWSALPGRMRVESLPVGEIEGDPPTRTFRYRLRPTQGGRIVLPPVPVSSFDPMKKNFATRYSPSVAVDVETPRFDASKIGYEDERANSPVLGLIAGFVIVMILGATLFFAVIARLVRVRELIDPVRIASELAKEFSTTIDEANLANRVSTAFASFLERVGGRPAGVLTPPEAREHVELLTTETALGERAGRLIERCDRVRFGGPDGRDEGRLAEEARDILHEVGRAMIRIRGETEGGSRGR